MEGSESSQHRDITNIYPEDVNRLQAFDLEVTDPVQGIRIVFEESSDFFGRITIYDVQIDGYLGS